MKQMLVAFSLTSFLLVIGAGASARAAGPWRAQIVDAETKQPLEGIIVVAVWWKLTGGPGGWSSQYYDSEEVLTDKDGRFTIASRTFFSLNPMVTFRGPIFTIFKPGYGEDVWPGWYTEATQWSPEKRKKLGQPWEFFQLEGLVLEMPRLRTIEERKKYLDRIGIDIPSMPFERKKMPLFERAIAEEREALYGP